MKKRAFTFYELIEKFNPYHDGLGRFSSKHGASSMTLMTASAAGQKAINNIRAKEGITSPGPDIKNAGKAAITREQSKLDIEAFENDEGTFKVPAGMHYHMANYRTDEALGEEWAKGLSAEESKAFSDYSSMAYSSINKANRLGPESIDWEPAREQAVKDSALIEGALDRASLATNTIAYRGSGVSMFEEITNDKYTWKQEIKDGTFDASQLEGITYTDKSFTSTSVNPSGAFEGQAVLIKYMLPQGAKAAPIHSKSQFAEENELLLQKGSQYLIHSANVVPVGNQGIHRLELVVEYLPPSGGK